MQPRAPYAKGKNTYWSLWDFSGQVWNGTVMGAFSNGSSTTYAFAMTDPAGIGDYRGTNPTSPAVPDGTYRRLYHECIAGVAPTNANLQNDSPAFWVDEKVTFLGGVEIANSSSSGGGSDDVTIGETEVVINDA